MTTPAPRLPRATGAFYRPELDGARSLAFLIVFVSHTFPQGVEFWSKKLGPWLGAWAHGIIHGGRFGVDLFFALSAYLITEILLREQHKSGTIDVKAFWMRRILRIWPLYFTFVLTALLVAPRVMRVEELSGNYKVAFLLFAGNWAIALFGWQQSTLMHLWSVSVEEQFYLTWPLVMRWLPPRRFVIVTAALIPISIAVRVYLIKTRGDGEGPHVWTNTLGHLDPIAMGALLAVALKGRSPSIRAPFGHLLAATGAFGLAALSRYDVLYKTPWMGALAYTWIAAACILVLVGVMAMGPQSVLATRAPVYIGKVSYGAYVFHLFFARLVQQRIAHPATPLVVFALTMAAAAVSYRYLETPFLRIKDRFAKHGVRAASREVALPPRGE